MASTAQKVLDVGINCQVIQGARWDEMQRLVESHRLFQEARDGFLTGEFTLDEYLELAEMHGINVDSYLVNVNQNLANIGIIV